MKKIKHLLLIVPIIFIFTGCLQTIAPKPIITSAPSYSGTNTHSGIIKAEYNNDKEIICLIITSERIDRYNALIEKYGNKFLPKIKKNYGITDLQDGTYKMDGEAVVKFSQMQNWYKNDIK